MLGTREYGAVIIYSRGLRLNNPEIINRRHSLTQYRVAHRRVSQRYLIGNVLAFGLYSRSAPTKFLFDAQCENHVFLLHYVLHIAFVVVAARSFPIDWLGLDYIARQIMFVARRDNTATRAACSVFVRKIWTLLSRIGSQISRIIRQRTYAVQRDLIVTHSTRKGISHIANFLLVFLFWLLNTKTIFFYSVIKQI